MKIRYSHINRESVLPLGKDMVQIPPIPPRFIDTIFSIGYIVGVISIKSIWYRSCDIIWYRYAYEDYDGVYQCHDKGEGCTEIMDILDLFQGIETMFEQSPHIVIARIALILLGFLLVYLGIKGTLEPLIMVPMGLGMSAVNAGVLFLENNQTGNLIINPLLSSTDDLMKYMQIDFLQPIYTLTFSNGLRGGHHTYIPYRQGNGPRCRFVSRSLHHRRCGRTYGFICITQAAHTEEREGKSHRQGTEKKQDHIQTEAGS